MILTKPKFSTLKPIVDNKGILSVLQFPNDIPFLTKRIFYIYDVNDNIIRGQHANKKSEFLFIALSGSCKIKYFFNKKFYIRTLDNPNQTLFIPKMIWKEMYDFKKDTVLLVLSNSLYDKKEYILNFNEYLSYLKGITNENKF